MTKRELKALYIYCDKSGDAYVPVPVTAAKHIAESFAKSIVVINAWDPDHKVMHTTTYGVSPEDKVHAARGGEMTAEALGMVLTQSRMHEDFRTQHNAAREKAMQEALEEYLPELKRMAAQVVSKPANFFARMVRDFERAMS